MAARSPQPTEAETVALLEKAIPENTKRATKYGVKCTIVYLRKKRNISGKCKFKTNIETFIQNSRVCLTNRNLDTI